MQFLHTGMSLGTVHVHCRQLFCPTFGSLSDYGTFGGSCPCMEDTSSAAPI